MGSDRSIKWPSGAGEMAERIRAHLWSATSLGPVEGWPTSLRVATRLLVNSRHPMFIWWGPEHVQIYNDAYRETMGPEKHPSALGRSGRETWAEIWDVIGPQIEQVMSGGPATWHEDQLVPVTRHGSLKAVWWTYSFSPIEDDAAPNGVGGVMVICRDVTEEHLSKEALAESEARQAFLLQLSDTLRPLADQGEIERAATRLLGEHLQTDRCFLSPVSENGQGMCVREEYLRGDASSVLGDYTFAQFGDFVGPELHAGRILAVEDVDALADLKLEERESYAVVGIKAYLLVPLVRDGHLAAYLTINHRTPRRWSDADKAVAQQTADRLWTARERGRAEAALRESEARQRLMVELVPALLWSASPDGQKIDLNESWSAYTGQSQADTQNDGWLDAIHHEDLPETRAAFEHAFTTGEPLEQQQRIRKMGEGWRWHLVRHVPVQDENGVITRWLGAAVDIHESKLAEQALKEAELRLQTLVEGVPQLVWRAVDTGQWTWASPQWTAFTGQAEPDSYGSGWLDSVHPDDRERVRAILVGAVERGEFRADHRILHAPERRYRWFQTRATPVRNGAGDIVEWLGTSTDVHDIRQLHERQGVLVAELQHRTRNLMGVVRSMADRTSEASRDLEDFRFRFHDRLEALARVQGLLSRLGETDRIAFDELIRTEIKAMDGFAERVTLEGPAGIRLRSSMVQTLAMALHELATNAVKYGALSQPQAKLAIRWRMMPPDERGQPWLHVDWRETGVRMPPLGAAPQGTGQGRELIEKALPYQLGAKTRFELCPDGVRCTLSIPVSASNVEMDSVLL